MMKLDLRKNIYYQHIVLIGLFVFLFSQMPAFGQLPDVSKKEAQKVNEKTIKVMPQDPDDPWETFNRGMFKFNKTVDGLILKPVASMYRDVLPTPVQDGVRNVLRNLYSPLTFINNLLQGKPRKAAETLARTIVNTTFGMGGIVDVASKGGIHHHPEDFGQTLSVWGVASGPYVVAPFIGPSNPRDLLGKLIDFLMDPFRIYTYNMSDHKNWYYIREIMSLIDTRSRNIKIYDAIEDTSFDFYATVRSLYWQHRFKEINDSVIENIDYSVNYTDDIGNEDLSGWEESETK